MKCPDCRAALERIAVIGFDESFRCNQCGGIFAAGWVVNKIASKPEDKLMIEPFNVGVELSGGEGKCPKDEQMLVGVSESDVPQEVKCKKCLNCGFWWFAGNNLFTFKHAYLVKQNFVNVWRKKELTAYALPALVAAFLLVGLGASVVLTRLPQNISTQAGSSVTNFSVVRTSDGKAVVGFYSKSDVMFVEYKKTSEELWTKVFIVTPVDGKYVIELKKVEEGVSYQLRIMDRVWDF